MDFFTWYYIPMVFTWLFSYAPDDATPGDIAALVMRDNYICLAVAVVVFIICLIFGGIGLNSLAKKEGMKPSAFAYLPFFNTYFAGKIAGETSFFGIKLKRAGLYAMLLEICYSLLEGARLVINFLLTRAEYFVIEQTEGGFMTWDISEANIPADKKWLYDMMYYCGSISYIFEIFAAVMLLVMFIALFHKYYARNPIIMAIMSAVFPFRYFVLFAVRNNERIDYEDFLRRRAEEYNRRHGYGPYQGGPYQGGPYEGNPNRPPYPPNSPAGDPFGDDPFGDKTPGAKNPGDAGSGSVTGGSNGSGGGTNPPDDDIFN